MFFPSNGKETFLLIYENLLLKKYSVFVYILIHSMAPYSYMNNVCIKAFEFLWFSLYIQVECCLPIRTVYTVCHMFVNWSVNVSFKSDYNIRLVTFEYEDEIRVVNLCQFPANSLFMMQVNEVYNFATCFNMVLWLKSDSDSCKTLWAIA